MTKPTTIDLEQLTAVTGGIIEGGCVVPDPMIEQLINSKKMPPPNWPIDLAHTTSRRPK
jgi:hypothetical protein